MDFSPDKGWFTRTEMRQISAYLRPDVDMDEQMAHLELVRREMVVDMICKIDSVKGTA